MARAINTDMFHRDGRGPELRSIYCKPGSSLVVAIDYFNPEDEQSEKSLKHVYLVAAQVTQFTPDEVIGVDQIPADLRGTGDAAMFDLGRTEWLESFSQKHLRECRHFKIFFYDELLDVICEEVICRNGGFNVTGG